MDSEIISSTLKQVKENCLNKNTSPFNMAQREFGTTNVPEQILVLLDLIKIIFDRNECDSSNKVKLQLENELGELSNKEHSYYEKIGDIKKKRGRPRKDASL